MTSDVQRRVVLLVEDDAMLAATMRSRIERLNCEVRLAQSGSAAADAWESAPPQVVFMDYRLPDGWGTEVVRRMRRRGRCEPVLFMTAESEALSPELRRELSVLQVLAKPVTTEALRNALDALPFPASTTSFPRGRAPSRHGRFRVVVLRGRMDGQRVAQLCRAARDERWLALQVHAPEQLDAAARRGICAWAGWLSSAGGRLCLIAKSAENMRLLQEQTEGTVDIVDSVERLLAHGLRLTGLAERRQLLDVMGPSTRRDV